MIQTLVKTRPHPLNAARAHAPFSEKDKKRVFIVDDHPILCKGLTQLINTQANLMVEGQAEEAHEAFERLAKTKVDIAIVDLSLKDGNGLELVKALKTRLPKLPVLVLSAHDEALYAERALRAGARGYIMKQEATEKLLGAIRQIINGEIYVSDDLKLRMLEKVAVGRAETASPMECLSDRELEVFQLIGRGFKTREIAEKLCVSFKTVDAYRTRIKEKLNLDNSAHLVHHAIQWLQESQKLQSTPRKSKAGS
jgi:DNA-binding NarL/FixJ family response regulator